LTTAKIEENYSYHFDTIFQSRWQYRKTRSKWCQHSE